MVDAVDSVATLLSTLATQAVGSSASRGIWIARQLSELLRTAAEATSSDDALEARTLLTAIQKEPGNADQRQQLQRGLFNLAVSDDDFRASLARLLVEPKARDMSSPSDMFGRSDWKISDGVEDYLNGIEVPTPREPADRHLDNENPVRGFPGLTVSAASPQTTAGSDFSIFVLVQNPFDVPITIHHVQTHIPIDLIDVIRWRAGVPSGAPKITVINRGSKPGFFEAMSTAIGAFVNRVTERRRLWREHPGVATAVGPEITPTEARSLFRDSYVAGGDMVINGDYTGVQFILPSNPSSEDLDAIMRRMADYQRGAISVQLQPGDSVVRQFVLRTRSRLFFRPLSHSFQIQVSYSVDGKDHTGTIPYDLTIQAPLGSISTGSVGGAILGTLVKSLSQPAATSISAHPLGVLQAVAVSVMASIAVVVAFARKSSAQPLVSIEDFWGGLVIGFTVGYFGFATFFGLFKSGG